MAIIFKLFYESTGPVFVPPLASQYNCIYIKMLLIRSKYPKNVSFHFENGITDLDALKVELSEPLG